MQCGSIVTSIKGAARTSATLFPFADGATAAFGSDAVFGGEVLGQKAVLFGPVAEKRDAAFVGHGETLRLRCVCTKGATVILHHCVCERS